MDELENFLRRCSKRLNSATKSVQVYDDDQLVAVIMNQDRYRAAIYSQKIRARKRVYRKTFDALAIKTIKIKMPKKIPYESKVGLLGKNFDLKPIFFERSKIGKASVCISPKSFRLLRKSASIKMSLKKTGAYLNGLPLYRNSGNIAIPEELKQV